MLRLTSGPARAMLPRAVTITDAPRVRALAGTLCTLPRMPRGLHCPAALGSALLLDFSAAGRAYPPVRIQDSGCATVTGVGPARQWSWSSRPGRVLSAAVGGKGRLVPGTLPEQRADPVSDAGPASPRAPSQARTATVVPAPVAVRAAPLQVLEPAPSRGRGSACCRC